MKKIIRRFLLRILNYTGIPAKQDKIIKLLKENLYASRFNSSIQDSNWLKYKSFSPGGWAVDYSFLFVLYKILNDMQPSEIIEFGLGQSSKMIHQYSTYFKKNAVTIEDDEDWMKFFNKDKQGEYGVNIHILNLQMINYNGFETRTYTGVDDFCSDKKFDLLVIDGPRGSEHYSRSQLINMAKRNLSDSFCIIFDDTERMGEQETLAEVYSYFKDHQMGYCSKTYSSLKSFTVVCSEDLCFLTTLAD